MKAPELAAVTVKKSNLGPCGCTVAPEVTAFAPLFVYAGLSKLITGLKSPFVFVNCAILKFL